MSDLVCLDAGPPRTALAQGAAWVLLVATGDASVVQAVRAGVAPITIEGRPWRVLHAANEAAALALVRGESVAPAVALIDIDFGAPGGGLRLVERLRAGAAPAALRIVLRGGDAAAPLLLAQVQRCDVDDVWSSEDLTPPRLLVGLRSALRGHAQLVELERRQSEWQRLQDDLQHARTAEREAADDRLRAERSLRQARQSLEACVEQRTRSLSAAIDEIDAFHRRVAQDLRGPLSGISGLSGLIRHGLDAGDLAQARHWASMLEQQSRRLADLVTSLLSLSEHGQGDTVQAAVPLARLAEEARDALRGDERPDAAARIRIARDLPALPVDPPLMRQVFVNLLDNALKFSRDVAEPSIAVEAERRGDEWRFIVSDDGVGFPPGEAQRMFEPFVRLHGAAFPGAGIGLTVVQRIVAHHGGRVWATGEPGRGARIGFTLPAGAVRRSVPDPGSE